MKAITFSEYGGNNVLQLSEIVTPIPRSGEVLVAVRGAAVNPADWKIRRGWVKQIMPLSFPAVLGGDIAGVVEGIGDGVTEFKPGDEVFGMLPLVGGYAEYAVVKTASLAMKPAALSFVQAASVPLAALTAWQALFEVADFRAGQRILIHAAAGGVGSFAVQFARWKGGEVIATASVINHEYLRELGAARCIDYRTQRLAAEVRDIDVVLDLVGGTTGIDSLALLKPGGIVVSVAGPPPAHEPPHEGKRISGARVRPDGTQLAKIAVLIDRGIVTTEIAAVFDLRDAAKAQELIEQGHTRGKIVLTIK